MSILASNFIFDKLSNYFRLTRFQPRVYVGMDVRIDIWIDSNGTFTGSFEFEIPLKVSKK